MTSIVRGVSSRRLLALRLHTQLLWNKYFKSVENVVMTTLEVLINVVINTIIINDCLLREHIQLSLAEPTNSSSNMLISSQIIRSRLNPRPLFVWNQPPGGLSYHQSFSLLPQAFPFYHTHSVSETDRYTAVITSARPATRESAPLISLIRALSTGAHLAKIVVLWTGGGPPRVRMPPTSVPVSVVRCEGERLVDRFWPLDYVETDAVLYLTDDVVTSSDEVCVCVCV